MHNDGLKIKNFEFLVVVGQFKLKKKWQFLLFEFFCLIPKNFLGFLM